MRDSEAKSKEEADGHDPAEDEEFVPEDEEAQASDEAEEPDPEDVKEALEDDEVNDEEPVEADEDQQAEVEEVYDSGSDLQEDVESEVSVEDDDEVDDAEPRGTKRDNEDENQSTPNKRQKDSSGAAEKSDANGADANGKVGSKHDDPRDPETQGSAERLPEVGQQVEWKALPGFVDGEVVEILREEKEVDGKNVKASEDDPRLVLKSNKSGKICVHKPEALYFK